ncbi:MAG: hypothetical protein U1E63_15875 [Burkholderiales bacterium]
MKEKCEAAFHHELDLHLAHGDEEIAYHVGVPARRTVKAGA